MKENEIAHRVIGIAIELHKALGPGLLENVYKECLCYKLIQAGFKVEKEKAQPLIFENVKFDTGYRIDLLVENALVIEIKCVDALNEVHFAQTLTYVKLGGYKLGLLINFNAVTLRSNIKRIINTPLN